jgi:hypothetical protein
MIREYGTRPVDQAHQDLFPEAVLLFFPVKNPQGSRNCHVPQGRPRHFQKFNKIHDQSSPAAGFRSPALPGQDERKPVRFYQLAPKKKSINPPSEHSGG